MDGCPRSPQHTWVEQTGEEPTIVFSRDRPTNLRRTSKSNRNISFSAQVRWGEPGAPVQFQLILLELSVPIDAALGRRFSPILWRLADLAWTL